MDDAEKELLLDGNGQSASKSRSVHRRFFHFEGRLHFILIHLIALISLVGNAYLGLLLDNVEERFTICKYSALTKVGINFMSASVNGLLA